MLRRSSRRLATLAPETQLTLPIAPNVPFKRYNAQFPAGKFPKLADSVTVTAGKVMEYYETIVRMRRMEVMCDSAYKARMFRGFCHLYIGQEAICTGMVDVLEKEDQIVTGYRDHCWHIARGGTPHEVFAEMMGKKTGCSMGKGGSMHMYLTKNNWFGGNGIVGAQGSLGAGLAWKHALTNGEESPKNVAVALYGDGAANQGQLYECFNLCALWKVPCIFVCENNHFGMGTADVRSSAYPSFYDRFPAVPGLKADGMNVFAVTEATKWAREWCLAGNGPVVLELDSYRYMGHSMSDPDSSYRTADDKKKVRDARDSVVHLKKIILEQNIATEADLKAIDKKIKTELDAELKQAKDDPMVGLEELASHVYAADSDCHVRGVQGTQWLRA